MWRIFIITILLLSGCNSAEKRENEFSKIQIGMVKSEVLAVAGNPHWSDRKNSQDRWIYYMNVKDRKDERVVYFEQGRVVGKGLRKHPILSAEEIEQVKAEKIQETKPHNRKLSDQELRKILEKEVEKESKKKTDNFEKI